MALYQMLRLLYLRRALNHTVVVNEFRASNQVVEAHCRVYANVDKKF